MRTAGWTLLGLLVALLLALGPSSDATEPDPPCPTGQTLTHHHDGTLRCVRGD